MIAVHDDLTILGPPSEVARCHERYLHLTEAAGLRLSVALWAHDPLPREFTEWLSAAGIRLEREALVLGSPVGVDRDRLMELAQQELASYTEFFAFLEDPGFADATSTRLLRASGLPRLNYLLRKTPPQVMAPLARPSTQNCWQHSNDVVYYQGWSGVPGGKSPYQLETAGLASARRRSSLSAHTGPRLPRHWINCQTQRTQARKP